MLRPKVPRSVKLWLESFERKPRDLQPELVAATSVWREDLSVPVNVITDWLPMTEAELVVSGVLVSLRDAAGQEVRLWLSTFVDQSGSTLRFHCRVGPACDNCIDFADMGRDATFQVECQNEATAEEVATRIKSLFTGPLKSWR